MGRFIDLTGQRFTRLTAISIAEPAKNGLSTRWNCRCDCGNTTIADTHDLRRGHKRSCGCLKIDMAIEFGKSKGKPIKSHYLSPSGKYRNTRLYNIWGHMKKRCDNSKSANYKYYGGRGIKVCAGWLDYQVFAKWAYQNGYNDNLSIDRIDVNGNYEPSNCQWVTMKEQQNNRRNNHLVTFNGETLTISEWSDRFKIDLKLVYGRLAEGWDIQRALTEPKVNLKERWSNAAKSRDKPV
jgi:hypothetical protein